MPYFLSSFILKDVFLMQKVVNLMSETSYFCSFVLVADVWGFYTTAKIKGCHLHKGLIPQPAINKAL